MTKAGRRWRIRYDLAPDEVTGRRRQAQQRGFATKRDAHRELRRLLRDVDRGLHVESNVQTVRQLLEEWLAGREPSRGAAKRHRGQLGIASWASYKSDLARMSSRTSATSRCRS